MELWHQQTSIEEEWRQFCDETGAKYIKRKLWFRDRVELRFQNWTIILDTFPGATEKDAANYTRIRASFINHTGFYFRAYRTGFYNKIETFFGSQDIEIGDREFDKLFIIKSNSENNVIRLFSNNRIKKLFHTQPKVDLQISSDNAPLGLHTTDSYNKLYFVESDIITDIERLKNLFDLFCEILTTLVEIGVTDDAPLPVAL